MHHRSSRRTAKSPLFSDERLRIVNTQLTEFFKTPDQSIELLKAIFERCSPAPSVHESIVTLYANSLSRPSLNRLFDRSVEHLRLNDDDCPKTVSDAHAWQYHRDADSCHLLHHAVMRNYENILRLLLNLGFDANNVLSDRKTPLSMAVVACNTEPDKRLQIVQLLIAYGANPCLRDNNSVSPFKRLCGLDSNYPTVYSYFRDYLLSLYADDVQLEFNSGLENALFNWCQPIVVDLLEHGATLDAFRSVDSMIHFFEQMASTFFLERHSIVHLDTFIECLIQLLLHGIPCADYATCIETFFEVIYIPGVCFETNRDPIACPSIANVKKLLAVAFHFGYLNQTSIDAIRTVHLPQIVTTPIENPLVIPDTRQNLLDTLNQHIDALLAQYQQRPMPLTLLAARKVRQALVNVNRRSIAQLNLSPHLCRKLL